MPPITQGSIRIELARDLSLLVQLLSDHWADLSVHGAGDEEGTVGCGASPLLNIRVQLHWAVF